MRLSRHPGAGSVSGGFPWKKWPEHRGTVPPAVPTGSSRYWSLFFEPSVTTKVTNRINKTNTAKVHGPPSWATGGPCAKIIKIFIPRNFFTGLLGESCGKFCGSPRFRDCAGSWVRMLDAGYWRLNAGCSMLVCAAGAGRPGLSLGARKTSAPRAALAAGAVASAATATKDPWLDRPKNHASAAEGS